MESLRDTVTRYCAEIGADRLLVQGAGGNVSWKEGEVMWVKASGTWLSEAGEKDIFVPVGLPYLREGVAAGNFAVTPVLAGQSTLRPSIETLLHALMPHRVVVHLHPIAALAHLVRAGFEDELATRLPGVGWRAVDYYKPGADLAAAVHRAIDGRSDIDVVFMANHGVVIGGDTVDAVARTLDLLVAALSAQTPVDETTAPAPAASPLPAYRPVEDVRLHALAFSDRLQHRMPGGWALYPDHVVFLGPQAPLFDSWDALSTRLAQADAAADAPDLAIVRGAGVYVTSQFNRAKELQLGCYFDVLVRQPDDAKLKELSDRQVAELLNWDAEAYRRQLAK